MQIFRNIGLGDKFFSLHADPHISKVIHGATNTGGEPPAVVNADSGTQVTVSDSGSLYKTGYTFIGWNTKEDENGKAYKAGDKIIIGSVNIGLYAQWAKAQFTITYHGNGNTSGEVPSKSKHLYQAEITIAGLGDLSKSGYDFIGWNTDSTGNGLDLQEGNKITIVNDIHLFARWAKKKFKLTFSGNGTMTSNVPAPIFFPFGAKIDSLSVVSSRQSYTFNGWFSDSLCTAKWEYNMDSVISNVTLYANWIIKDIDGNIYTEVKIGDQIWMVQNLKVTKYNDSSVVSYITDHTQWEYNTGSYCYYANDTAYKHKYGGLYDWQAVNTGKLAPLGWHIPSKDEFQTLIDYLIANGYNYNGSTLENTVARSLALNSVEWELSEIFGSPGYDRTSGNIRSGFKLVPGGYISGGDHFNNGEFRQKGIRAMLWSSTEYQDGSGVQKSNAWYLDVQSTNVSADLVSSFKKAGRSVRCIRDY